MEAITNIEQHLIERGVDLTRTPVILDKEHNYASFLLFNLSGKLVGFQNYNPNADKTRRQKAFDNKGLHTEDILPLMRYYSFISSIDRIKELAVWGLETVRLGDMFMFLTEGIFDMIKVHNAGFPGVAVLGNDPKRLRNWLTMMPQKRIVICDDDKAGRKLRKLGHYSFTVPEPYNDLGDMSNHEASKFIKGIYENIQITS